MIVPTTFDGRLFSDFNVAVGMAFGQQPGPTVTPIALARHGQAPLYAGSVAGMRTITLDFTVLPTSASAESGSARDVWHSLARLLGHLRPGDPAERVLVGELADGPDAGLELEASAAVGQFRYNTGRNGVLVDFHVRDARWQRRTVRETPTVPFSAAAAMPLVNRAPGVAYPTIKLTESVARTTNAATVGWKYVRAHTVTNATTRNWWRVRYTIDLGDTSAWVTASKAQADGDDVRIRSEGREYNRTLTNFNTKRTFAHIEIDVPAGESLTLQVWYGNTAATAPDDLSTRTRTEPTYAADDLEGDSGTATSGGGSTLTNSGETWETNRWRRGYIQITGGTGSGQRRQISSNTSTEITVTRAWGTNPNNTSTYVIWRSGVAVSGGRVTARTSTSITDNAHSPSWGTNEWDGATVTFVGGTASPSTMTVASNTADTLAFTGTFSVNPTVNDVYYMERYGMIQYHVDTAVYETDHRGLWRLNKYHNKGGRVAYGDQTPGGWVPWLMLPNNDDKAQGRFVDESSGGGHAINNWPGPYARRSVRSANTWPEKGQADGVAFTDPRGLQGFRWDYRVKNEGGIGIVEVRSQEPFGDDWQTVASDSTTRSSLTAVTSSGATGYSDLTSDATPVRVWCGVLPVGGTEIPSTERKDRSIELRPNTLWQVVLDIDGISGMTASVPVIGAEASKWDVQTTLRLGGGSDLDPPYQIVQYGGANHWLAVTSTYELWVNAQPDAMTPLFGVYVLNDLNEHVPWAGTIEQYEVDTDGSPIAQVAGQLLPLHQLDNMMGTAADTTSGWTKTDSSGVTSAISNDTSPDYDGNDKSLSVDVTTTPAGAWTITLDRTVPITVTPGTLYEWAYAAQRTGMANDITVTMLVEWGDGVTTGGEDDDQTVVRTLVDESTWYTNGGGKKVFAGNPVDAISVYGPTIEFFPTITIAGTGSTSGNVNLKIYLTTNGLNLYVSESEIGTITVEGAWRESWIG